MKTRWRGSDVVLGLAAVGVCLSAWIGGYVLNGGQKPDYFGGDFLQFYTAGQVVNLGQVDRLYDQPYFRGLQLPVRQEGQLYSLYPPMMAILMTPIARLPYWWAVVTWWGVQAGCFTAAGFMLNRLMARGGMSLRWRVTSVVALASLLPVWIAVGSGHLVPLLLVILLGGFMLHLRGDAFRAGLVFSLLALKPQVAVGLLLWLIVRRDLRTIAGLFAGLAAQGIGVVLILGPGVCFDYLHAMPIISSITRAFRYSPIYEQSFAGIVSNWMWMHGYDKAVRVVPMRIIHVLTAGAAAVMLCRVVWLVRSKGSEMPAFARHFEYACVVLFLLMFTPYLLVYDLTMLAIPLAVLWASPGWRTGLAMYASMTVAAGLLYLSIGFSVTGVVGLWAMFAMWRQLEGKGAAAHLLDTRFSLS